MVRKTKKASKKSSSGMTVPQLRKSFEHIEAFARKHSVEEFCKEWKKVFGKCISKAVAQDYVTFIKQQPTKQSGGAASSLQGAPLDYTLRAGADPSTAARVPEYVQSGFGFKNMDSFLLDKTDITPRIPAGLGSNEVKSGGGKKRMTRKQKLQKGGAFPSLSTVAAEMFSRPLTMSSPPSVGGDLMMATKAHAGDLSSPRPEVNPLNLTTPPSVYSANTPSQLRTF